MAESLPQNQIDTKSNNKPPKPDENFNALDLMEWWFKYVFTPLIPFFIGATIRLLEAGKWSVTALDPAELSFSLAMFCLFATVSARKLKESEYRETIAGLYTFGAFLFISMFSYSVSQSAQLTNHELGAIQKIINIASVNSTITLQEISNIANKSFIDSVQTKSNIVLIIVGIIGIVFVVMGLGFRHTYKLGDEK